MKTKKNRVKYQNQKTSVKILKIAKLLKDNEKKNNVVCNIEKTKTKIQIHHFSYGWIVKND